MGVQVVSTTTASTTSVVRLRANVVVSDVVASATYEIPASQIEYIDLSVGVVLDTVGRFKLLADFVDIADAVSKSFAKGLTDAATATASQPALEALKGLSDSFSLTDQLTRTLVFLRNFADTATVAETSSFQFTRGVQREFLLAVDTQALDFTKTISNIAFATDISTRSVSKGLADSASVGDNSFLQFSATRVESTVVADEGFLFAQNYCDLTYFASDYVGVSRSF